MFKKQQDTSLAALTPRRHAVVKPRLYKFPPLRKSWQQIMGDQGAHQQLLQDFQDGVNRGFAQGMEQGKEEGYQEGVRLGFDDGIRKGLAEGKQQAKQQFISAAVPLENVLGELQSYLAAYEQRRREELLQLVEKVARQVIRCELALRPTQLLTLVEEALSSLPLVPEQIRVHLNSEEFNHINEIEPEKVKQWGLCANAELAMGECRVVTDTSEMDIGCQHRLDQCIDVLKDTLLAENHDE